MIYHKIYNIYIYMCERLIRELLREPGSVDKSIDELNLPTIIKDPFCELLTSTEIKELFEKLQHLTQTNSNKKAIHSMPEYDLTMLEKQWIKTILQDPRAKLFDIPMTGLEDIEPLYTLEDFVYFDRPVTSDPWSDNDYIEHFKMVYRACKNGDNLAMVWRGNENAGWLKWTNTPAWAICKPVRIEYDNRLDAMFIYAECEYPKRSLTTKLLRIPMRTIISCRQANASEYSEIWKPRLMLLRDNAKRMIEIEQERSELRKAKKPVKPKKNRIARLYISDKQGAFTRALACFASYQKRDIVCLSEEKKQYCLEFYYDWKLDIEYIINDILSLGCHAKVESPPELASAIKQRWKMQTELQKRMETASKHTIVDLDEYITNRDIDQQNSVSFENIRSFVLKVVVTRPNTEVKICCLRCAIYRDPETNCWQYGEDYQTLYEADCDGDGIYEKTRLTGDLIHVYEKPGTYTIAIRGNFGHILLRDGKHGELDLMEVSNYLPDSDDYYWSEVCQWGDIKWRSMAYMFAGAYMIRIPAPDAPDLSLVEDMEGMFYDCIKFNDPVEHWNVSNVRNMAGIFERAAEFNQPLERWDVSNVQNMADMFAFASSFNQPVNLWNVSNVRDMESMFKMAESFNQAMDTWDVSQVQSMDGMFCGAISYRQNLDTWNISALKSSNNMFAGSVSMKLLPKWRHNDAV